MDVADGVPLPQRYWAILTVALGITLSVLDGAIANVALPTIARDLHASPAASIWVVNAYQLTIIISLLPLASIGEIVGYARVYRVGLVIFTLASFACAISHSLVELALARAMQGFGAAGLMSVSSALTRFIYPRQWLGRGIGLNAVAVAVAAATGPTVAAAILSVASWPWLFAVNVPTGIAALVAARALPRIAGVARRFDVISAVLNGLTFGLLIIGIDGLGHGEGTIIVAAVFTASVIAGTTLVLRQLTGTSPLLPIDLLRRPIVALSVSTSVCSFVAQMTVYVSLPFYLQNVLGRTQVETGLLMTPWPVAVGIVAPIAGRLGDRYPAGILGGIGLAVFATGLTLMALIPQPAASADIAWRMAVCGIGFGFFQSPNNRAILTNAPRARSGAASGLLAMSRLLGQTIGAAFVAVIFNYAPARANHVALVVGASFAAVAAVVSFLRLMNRAAPVE